VNFIIKVRGYGDMGYLQKKIWGYGILKEKITGMRGI